MTQLTSWALVRRIVWATELLLGMPFFEPLKIPLKALTHTLQNVLRSKS